jgi:hypothetical protein
MSNELQVEQPPTGGENVVEPCPSCAAAIPAAEQFVFAIGKLDVRFPSVGIEREFRRCAKLVSGAASMSRGERLRKVLEANQHLAVRVCYLLVIGAVPAYVVAPPTALVRETILAGLSATDKSDQWAVLVGRQGPVCSPSDCGGLLVPMAVCDQLYVFSVEEWLSDLTTALKPAVGAKKTNRETLSKVARELFNQTVSALQNIGATDAHRALNFLLMRHPGLFLAAAERAGKSALDKIETRVIHGLGTRRLVAVILTFLDLTTGVPERLFCRVDVTEEWPFVADQADGSPAPLGLLPFIENELLAAAY